MQGDHQRAARRVLGLIPARGGSKGIQDKNLRPLAGRPLLAYAIEAAARSGVVDRIVVSTDSTRIAELALALGAEVPCLRPAELALDETPMLPVVQHAIVALESLGWSPEIILLLQPTAPLRRPEHLRRAVEELVEERCDAVVSVVAIPAHFSPHYAMRIDAGRLVPYMPDGDRYTRRQDVPTAYSRDGTVYACRGDVVMAGSLYGRDCRPLVLSEEETVNIDTMSDWERAEARVRGMRE